MSELSKHYEKYKHVMNELKNVTEIKAESYKKVFYDLIQKITKQKA